MAAKQERKAAPRRWSGRVTAESNALDLDRGVFKRKSPRSIARSLKRSAERSTRRKAPPFRSAMSMLTFYINRGRQEPRCPRPGRPSGRQKPSSGGCLAGSAGAAQVSRRGARTALGSRTGVDTLAGFSVVSRAARHTMPLEFSAQSKQRIESLLSRYPAKQAALLPVLHIAQDEFGHLPDEAIELVRPHRGRLAGARVRRRHLLHDVPPREARAERAHGLHEHLVHAARRVRHPPPHRAAAGHQGRRDHRRRRVHGGRGGVPGGLRERAHDDLRQRLLPRPDARRRSTRSSTICASAGASGSRRRRSTARSSASARGGKV